MSSWKRLTLAAASAAALTIVGLSPTNAEADHRHRHHGHRHHGHRHHGQGHHGHWHHNSWHYRPYLAGPPIVLRGAYYPAQYYYAPPIWYNYGYFGPYYSGELYYNGW